jgi:hypothetical protein
VDCGLWTVDFGLWTIDCGLLAVDCARRDLDVYLWMDWDFIRWDFRLEYIKDGWHLYYSLHDNHFANRRD